MTEPIDAHCDVCGPGYPFGGILCGNANDVIRSLVNEIVRQRDMPNEG